jgi:DNA-binding NarL/FixJ family response regulator
VSFRLCPRHQSLNDSIVAAAREGLGEQAFAEAWIEGRMLSQDDLVATALAVLALAPNAQESTPAPKGDARSYGVLSPREHEVLQYVAAGWINRQIANKLIISVATVNYHVTSVLNKLGADNRTQAVTLATQRGLCRDIPGMG